MSNPHKEGSANWAGWEKENARRTGQSSTGIGQQEVQRMEAEKRSQRERDSGGGCFPAGCLITTTAGNRAIEHIRAGDIVLSWNASSREWEKASVLKLRVHKPRPIIEVRFEDGGVLRTTRVHSFLTSHGWKMTAKLGAGDEIATCIKERGISFRGIAEISSAGVSEPVYNLVTSHSFNYVADGVVAHNFTYFRRTRGIYWKCVGIVKNLGSQISGLWTVQGRVTQSEH